MGPILTKFGRQGSLTVIKFQRQYRQTVQGIIEAGEEQGTHDTVLSKPGMNFFMESMGRMSLLLREHLVHLRNANGVHKVDQFFSTLCRRPE